MTIEWRKFFYSKSEEKKRETRLKTDRIRGRLKEIQVENTKRRQCEWKRESKETRMKMLKIESNTYW